MLDRQNYLKVKLFLKFSRDVHGRSSLQISNDFEHLKTLLLWAGSQPLSSAPAFNTSLPDFLFQKVDKGLDQAELQNILNTNQRFFLWTKAMFPDEFKNIHLSWIIKISAITEGKEVII
ncbi:hypothetical protein LARV_01291 [Longilinea arvoryzae]|uniref:Uncharacterized protein n=1 Tax=Longilinea arvoryzae TaxID=360412 RepID=A0A0S7BEY2_9CHLR|nr:hypothetical protein [Longilinea arvoryzae]GAP13536.1 hypothetical protein LARV_01291 [Longilinea arvoryzae]